MMPLGSGPCLLASGAIALMAACAVAEPPPPNKASESSGPTRVLGSSTLVPGVLLEPGRSALYLMRPGGGIEALDVDTGGLHWATEHADQPLFVANGVLLARVESFAPSFAVALLDPATGEPAADPAEPFALPLPEGVTAVVDQTLERSFTHSVRVADGAIYLTWDFIERDVSGVSPPGGRPFARSESGAFRYLGGAFEAVTAESIRAQSETWPAEVQELVESKRVPRPPWQAKTVLAVALQRYAPDRLVLRRWRRTNGEELPERVLYPGRALAVLGSCNERHVVVAAASARPAPEPYVLHYHDLDSGEPVARVRSTRSAGPFCLLGSRLLRLAQPELRRVGGALVENPLELVASDAGSGTEVWRRAVRDTSFRGLAPPLQ